MKKTVAVCLFFFCFLLCAGCGENGNDMERKETGKVPSTNILFLSDGEPETLEAGEMVCERVGGEILMFQKEEAEVMMNKIALADYLFIGIKQDVEACTKELLETLGQDVWKDKKLSFLLIDKEEEREIYEEKLKKACDTSCLLPSFYVNTEELVLEEGSGRMNGWLTTILTYESEGF